MSLLGSQEVQVMDDKISATADKLRVGECFFIPASDDNFCYASLLECCKLDRIQWRGKGFATRVLTDEFAKQNGLESEFKSNSIGVWRVA